MTAAAIRLTMPETDRAAGPRRAFGAARVATVWATRYGLPGLAIRGMARRGDLIAGSAADPALLAAPFETYEKLRALGPVTANRFLAATTDHGVANQVLRSEEFLVAPGTPPTAWLARLMAAAVDPRALGPQDAPSLLAIQPPRHTTLRKMMTHAFTPRAITAYAPRIWAIAEELLERAAAKPGGFDVIADYAALLPVTVIAEILGVPTDLRDEFLAMGNDAALTLDPVLSWRDYRRADRSLRRGHEFFDDHIAALRRAPGDDLLSELVQAAPGGTGLTDEELRVNSLLLLGAGFETTVNLIGNAVPLLLGHPDQLAGLRDDAAGWDNAVEEVLRFDAPVQVTLRTPRAETELGGRPMRAGTPLLVMIGGANRDPAVFEDPARFDVTRRNARAHLSFSAGAHYCLGAQLARLEAAIALEALFDRFPGLHLTGAPTRRMTRVLRGYEHLPVIDSGVS